MAKELSVLQQQAEAIKTEVNKGANTSERVGGMLEDMLDYNEEQSTTANSNTGVSEYEPFSDQNEYKAGDVTTYNGNLFEFTVDHPAGAWNTSHVEATSLKKIQDKKLTELEINMSEIKQSVSDIYGFGMNEKRYIRSSDGVQSVIDDNWACLEKPIECKEGEIFSVNLNGNNGSRVLVFAAYDENSQYLPDKSINGANWDGRKEIVIPDGVKFCNFCSFTINLEYFVRPTKNLLSDIQKNKAEISSITDIVEYEANNIGYIDKNGSLINDSNWCSSDIIECKYGDCFLIDLPCDNKLVNTISYYRYGIMDKDLSIMGNSFKNYVIRITDKTINGIRFSGGGFDYIGKRISIKKIEIYAPEIKARLDNVENHKAYTSIIAKKGFIYPNGTDGSNTDENWVKTDFLLTSNLDKILLNLQGTVQIGTICYYDSEKNFLPDISIAGIDKVFLNEEYTIDKSGFYVRICGKSSNFGNYTYRSHLN